MPKYILLVIIFVFQGNGEECPLGKYGETCEETCSPNCAPSLTDQSVHCHKLTGRCSEGCKRGWHGDQCNDLCSKNCLNSICNVQTGTCINCEVNYSGDYCETSGESGTKQETASTPLAAILVPVFAILIIIIIIIIITATVYRWWRIRRRRSEEALHGKGSNADEGDSLINTPLIVACKDGELKRVRDILNQNSEDINKRGEDGLTAVVWAARKGHREVVELLVGNEADLGRVDCLGNNILHWACYGGYADIVEHVVSKSMVDINRRGQDGRTPLMWAARHGKLDIFNFLLSKGRLPSEVDKDGDNILLLACSGGNVDIVKYVLSLKTVGTNCRGQSDRTPLMVAAYKGHENIFDELLKEGADVTLVDEAGDNVLHSACQGGHVDIVRRVLELGNVEINKQGQYHRTPLMTAARLGHKAVFDLLLNEGADASPEDEDGNNILHLACKGGHLEIVKSILPLDNVDIDARNRHNKTAAMLATNGDEVFEFLVSRGCLTT
ncbi:kinase D-interacting substrate of 220 kDa B-like [Haliotis rufescens]|uniref:kinase D-interacting substrate of 220 kDa B-like n=1 Tax=Haliotis rufescens TaxID=6454 RepID=UPI00201EBD83|nr:kinase D-interacting substrate of 220 kDa B-like [Haliotis rufescens]